CRVEFVQLWTTRVWVPRVSVDVGNLDRSTKVHAETATRASSPEENIRARLVFIARQATVCECCEFSTATVQVAVDQRQLRTRRSVVFGRGSDVFEFELAICDAVRVVIEDNSGLDEKNYQECNH